MATRLRKALCSAGRELPAKLAVAISERDVKIPEDCTFLSHAPRIANKVAELALTLAELPMAVEPAMADPW